MAKRIMLSNEESDMIRQRSSFWRAEISSIEFSQQRAWSDREVTLLKQELAKTGWSYQKIANLLPGRTADNCRVYAKLLVRHRVLSRDPAGGGYFENGEGALAGGGSRLTAEEDSDSAQEPPSKRARFSGQSGNANPDCESNSDFDNSSEEDDGSSNLDLPLRTEQTSAPRDAVTFAPNQINRSHVKAILDHESDTDSISSSKEEDDEEQFDEPPKKTISQPSRNMHQMPQATIQVVTPALTTNDRSDSSLKEAPYRWKNPARRAEDLPPSEYKHFKSFTVGENKILQELVSAGMTASEIAGALPKKSRNDVKRQTAHLWNFGLLPDLHALPEFSDNNEEADNRASEADNELVMPTGVHRAQQASDLPIHSSRRSSQHTIKPEAPSPVRHTRASATLDNGISVTVFGPDGVPLHPARVQRSVSEHQGHHGFEGCMHAGNVDPTPPDPLADMNDPEDEQDRLEQEELLRMKQELALLQKLVNRQNRAREMEMVGAEIERLRQVLRASRDSEIPSNTQVGGVHG